MGDSAKNESKLASFWKGVKTEFHKVTWRDKTDLIKQSTAVLCISIVLGLIITFLDSLIQFGINFLTAL